MVAINVSFHTFVRVLWKKGKGNEQLSNLSHGGHEEFFRNIVLSDLLSSFLVWLLSFFLLSFTEAVRKNLSEKKIFKSKILLEAKRVLNTERKGQTECMCSCYSCAVKRTANRFQLANGTYIQKKSS